MSASKGDFVVNIRIVVSGLSEQSSPTSHVNDILQELVNRRDFRHGQLARGVYLKHSTDYDSVKTTLEVDHARLQDPL